MTEPDYQAMVLEKQHKRERDLAIENDRLHKTLSNLRYVARHLSCLYGDNPEDGIDHSLHCCDWNEIYHQCVMSDERFHATPDELQEIAGMLTNAPEKMKLATDIASKIVRLFIERGWKRPSPSP